MLEKDDNVDKYSVLVVDDEQKILEAVDRELMFWKAEKGVTLHKATSARKALDILAEHHDSIQVLVSDLKMSGMGGDELVSEAKRLYPRIRSILMTGYSEVGGVSRAVSAGITAFIQKPWETRAFISEIEKAMAQYAAEEATTEHMRKVTTQLKRTGEMQRNLFRHAVPASARYSVDVAYHPLSEFHCGGDFYQVIPLNDQAGIFVIGDVSGHGLEAAFITGIVHTLISREELTGTAGPAAFSPSAFLERLNELLLRELAPAPDCVITLTAAFLDCARGSMVFCNAGSLPVYLIRADSSEIHSVPGLPCGFSSGACYEGATLDVHPGDRVVFMTDGLLERGRVAGFVSQDAVRSILQHFSREPDFLRKVVKIILEMFPEKKFYDDATLMSVTIR